MRRRLPPLHALRAFEAAARHLNFGHAAEELLLTPGAISHHVRHLEAELGVPLFVRATRAVSLTPQGQQLLGTVSGALDLLAQGTQEVRTPERETVRISLLSSFATHWLLRRLPRFEAAHPTIDLIFDTTTRHAEFTFGVIDVAIRYGPGGWPGVEARLLLLEHLAPVCAPSLLRDGPPLHVPEDLESHVCLLSFAKEPFEWLAWAESAGVAWTGSRTRMLHDYNLVLQAAVAGQGVAMGRRSLIMDWLNSGDLVEPFGPGVPLAGIGHWVVTGSHKIKPATAAFVNWIIGEADSSVA